MAVNYLITGYHGEAHVTAENDRGINAATFGSGRYVLDVGKKFQAEYIGNNTVRVYDGKLVDGGAVAGIPAGEYIELNIPSCFTGQKRNDLIVFQYEKDASTLIERGSFVVVTGATTTGTATDPNLTQVDLLLGTATFDQMPLWRVSVNGTTISAPVKVYEDHIFPVSKGGTGRSAFDYFSVPWAKTPTEIQCAPVNQGGAFYSPGAANDPRFGTLPIAQGGTGAITAALARQNLGLPQNPIVSDSDFTTVSAMTGQAEGLYLVQATILIREGAPITVMGFLYYGLTGNQTTPQVISSGIDPCIGLGTDGRLNAYALSYRKSDDKFYVSFSKDDGSFSVIGTNVSIHPLF